LIDTVPEEIWLLITTHFTHYELTLMVLMYVSRYFKRESVKLLKNCKSIQYMKMCDESTNMMPKELFIKLVSHVRERMQKHNENFEKYTIEL
jgi:hypothetical protein